MEYPTYAAEYNALRGYVCPICKNKGPCVPECSEYELYEPQRRAESTGSVGLLLLWVWWMFLMVAVTVMAVAGVLLLGE